MARILVFCSRTPYPLTGGAKIRMFNTAKALTDEHIVDLLIVEQGDVSEEIRVALERTFNDVVFFSYPKYRFSLNTFRGIASKKPLQTFYYHFSAVQDWIDKREKRYDILYCNHIRTTEYVRHLNTTKVVDLVDAISRNYASSRRSGIWRVVYPIESRRLLDYERKIVREFDHAFITTDADKRYIEPEGQRFDFITTLPNGVRKELLDQDSSMDDGHSIVFLGKMDYFPNEDAVSYFSSDIFPRIRDIYPEAEFFIVGSSPSKTVRALDQCDGITVTGFVEDPAEYLRRAAVVVAPMRYGAGLQNKVLEAMALGKPTVTTSLGQEGINAIENEHVRVADGPDNFTDAVIELLVNPEERKRLGQNAYELISNEYTWNNVNTKLLCTIQNVIK